MKIFLDTNVLISAVATRGLCADVMREVLVSHQLIVSSELFDELTNVLRDKFDLPTQLIQEFMDFVRQDARLSKPHESPEISLSDKSDLPILGAALSGGADLFVTGDKELLDLRKIKDMKIVSPRGFWEILRTGPAKK